MTMGQTGPAIISALLAFASAVYCVIAWPADSFVPKNTVQSFTASLASLPSTLQTNRRMLAVLVVQSLFEGCTILISFYWAPWMSLSTYADPIDLPFGRIFAALTAATALGSYACQIFFAEVPAETTLRRLLMISTAAYLVGSMYLSWTASASAAFVLCLVLQFCAGLYWPSIGHLRGKTIPAEVSVRHAFLSVSSSL